MLSIGLKYSGEPLTLRQCWDEMHDRWDALVCHSDHQMKMEENYGERIFRCNHLMCNSSRIGFRAKVERDQHARFHKRSFKCGYPSCKFAKIGFFSQNQLKQHTEVLHEHSELSDFVSEATIVAKESNQSTETAAEALDQGELRLSTLTPQEDLDQEIRSIESNEEEIASQQSTSTTLQQHIAEKLLGDLLAHNKELQPLYKDALARVDKIRLTDNLRRLLKYYYLDLYQSADTNLHRAASQLLRKRWSRLRIAQQIVDAVVPPDEEFHLQIEQRTQEKLSKLSGLETWISQTEHLALYDAVEGQTDDDKKVNNDGEDYSTGDESSSNGDDAVEGAYDTNHKDKDILPNIAAAENFLLAGIPFRKLCISLQLFLLPANLASLTRIIMTIPGDRIWFSDEEDCSILNRFKASVEARTEENWNWWPLQPRMLKLQSGQTRIHWRCVSPSSIVDRGRWSLTTHNSIVTRICGPSCRYCMPRPIGIY